MFLLCLTVSACGEDAREISAACSFSQSGKALKEDQNLLDRDYDTFASILAGRFLEIDAGGSVMGSVYFKYQDRTVNCHVEAYRDGTWHDAGSCGTYLTEWIPLPYKTTKVRLVNDSRSRLLISEVYAYAPGRQPRDCATWHTGGKCDLMLISCHPDDEVLWFGGLLPTYAGDRAYEVQVVCTVPSTPTRRLELLDSLWHCGVTRYPHFLGLKDARHSTLAGQYRTWQKDQLLFSTVKAIRMFQPEVVVSHDLKGEYGHGAHMATADCAMEAVELADNPKRYAGQVREYGVWTVKKLYLHLYPENVLEMDWHQSLDFFGGDDGITVASEAFLFHRSQLKTWAIEDGGAYSNARFGLVSSTVGPDTEKNDFMENTGLEPNPAARFVFKTTEGPVEEDEADDTANVLTVDLSPDFPDALPSPLPDAPSEETSEEIPDGLPEEVSQTPPEEAADEAADEKTSLAEELLDENGVFHINLSE